MGPADVWELRYYQTANGRIPFREWELSLQDVRTARAVASRLIRFRAGLFGDCKAVGEGVMEFRLNFGPGYRGYFSRVGARLVLLLRGGDKGTQAADIVMARRFRRDYEQRTRGSLGPL